MKLPVEASLWVKLYEPFVVVVAVPRLVHVPPASLRRVICFPERGALVALTLK